jgi:myosin-1
VDPNQGAVVVLLRSFSSLILPQFFDNQIVLTLIEGKKPPGIFSLLDDMGATAHAMESHAVDAKALEKLKGSCSSNAHFRGMDTAFSIKHYAGTVTYEINGFIEKNKDTLFPDLIETMQSSTNPFIVGLFPEDTSSSQNKRPTTAGFKIKSSAADLMTALSRCSPHYIRCIKPNDEKKASTYDDKRVAHQVQYLGLLENVKVRRAGFAFRAEFARFVQRYKKTSPQTWGMWGEWTGNPQQGAQLILGDNGVAATEFQFGKTKVFLKSPETLFFMEEQIEKFAFGCTVTIQNAWRNFKLRKKALEEAANAADLLRGRKQRNRDSVNRKFLADYMKYAENYGLQEAIKQGGGAGEEMVFANAIEAFNRRLKTEKRDFVITNKALYFVSRKKKGATVLYKVTKRTELSAVTQVSLSTFADDYIIIHCNDFDQAFSDVHKTEIATKIVNYAKALTNRTIPVNFQAVINYKIKVESFVLDHSSKS